MDARSTISACQPGLSKQGQNTLGEAKLNLESEEQRPVIDSTPEKREITSPATVGSLKSVLATAGAQGCLKVEERKKRQPELHTGSFGGKRPTVQRKGKAKQNRKRDFPRWEGGRQTLCATRNPIPSPGGNMDQRKTST